MPWAVIEIPVPDEASETVAERLRAAGADGVSEEWRKGQNYVRAFWKDGVAAAVADATEAALRALVEVEVLPAVPAFTLTSMEDQDWLEGWKQYFSPLEISSRLAVVPSWETFTPKPEQAIITLDPGMAFGTGTHGTTYTCLLALSNYLTPGMRVCDVGTGSGILAIAAVKLGAREIVATDNDPLAVRVAQENAELNGVAGNIDFRVNDLLADIAGPFDLVLANILAPVILLLIPQLPQILPPGALFISSGYITSQEDEIRTALQAAGHVILARYEREDWVTTVSSAGR
ncbi:MAG TPA: 50S ribosomal protein L11 methyltransferase [Armatimonadota bacterium]|jgi:ribosomal protein L11 methyltransferase